MQTTTVSQFELAPALHPSSAENQAIGPLLELSLAQTNAQGAYVYRFDREALAAVLVASAGPALHGGGPGVAVEDKIGLWHFGRCSPIVLQERSWSDWRFEGLPEFREHRFEGVVSVPLVESEVVVGMANFCRIRRIPHQTRELSFLLGLSDPIAALLAGTATREKLGRELQNLTQQLADRKLLERAKGLLQLRFGWSEEYAYSQIRRVSRRKRLPTRQIALDIIDDTGLDWAGLAVGSGN